MARDLGGPAASQHGQRLFGPWDYDGTLDHIHHVLYVKCRGSAQRDASPTAAIIDSCDRVSGTLCADEGSANATHAAVIQARSPTYKPHPDTGGGEFDEREVIGVVLLESRGDCSGMLEFAEKAFDEVAVTVEPWAEGRDMHAPRPLA